MFEFLEDGLVTDLLAIARTALLVEKELFKLHLVGRMEVRRLGGRVDGSRVDRRVAREETVPPALFGLLQTHVDVVARY